jgi:hypothetical protein
MGKIGDLWVRLGLKSDDYKKGMKEAKNETSRFSQGLSKMKASALAVWAAVGAAVMQFAKDFIGATNVVSDAWSRTMSSIKASYQSVLADITNYKPDFSSFRNFWKNEWKWVKNTFGSAQEAGDAAAEMTRAFDAEFELVNSVRLQKQLMQEELNELYITMRDTTLSPAARKAAANRYKEMLQPLADAEISIYSNMLEKASEAWQAGAGLSRMYSTDEMREFFANYGTDTAGMTAKYAELARVYETRKGDKQNQVIFDTLSKLAQAESQMSEIDKLLSRIELAINKQLQSQTQRADLALPAVAAITGEAESNLPNTMTSDWLKQQAEFNADAVAQQAEWINAMQQGAQMFHDSVVSSIVGGMQEITDALFGLEDADASSILAALMQPFADTAVQFGGMLIATGLGIEAFQESLKSLRPEVALAAGAALLALGAVMKSGIKSLAGGGAGAGTSSSYGGSSYKGAGDLNYDSTLTVYVEGKVSGSDILLAGSNQQNKWNR